MNILNETHMESIVREVIRQVKSSARMNLKLATAIMEKVEAEATRMGVKAVVAVSDASGRPVAVHCMDGAYIGSYDIAVNKTYTSVAFQMPTANLAELAAPGGSLYGIQHTNDGKVVIFGGGEPLYLNGELFGAIGVSGGTAKQDTELGAYGKKVFEELI